MPKNVKVEIGVSVSNAANGKVEIEIKPWRVHLAEGDTLEWVPVVHNNDDIVKWFRIETASNAPAWPFPNVPPAAAYTGTHAQHAKSQGRKAGLTANTTIPYNVVIAFKDDLGNERTATVDPDMVMD